MAMHKRDDFVAMKVGRIFGKLPDEQAVVWQQLMDGLFEI